MKYAIVNNIDNLSYGYSGIPIIDLIKYDEWEESASQYDIGGGMDYYIKDAYSFGRSDRGAYITKFKLTEDNNSRTRYIKFTCDNDQLALNYFNSIKESLTKLNIL